MTYNEYNGDEKKCIDGPIEPDSGVDEGRPNPSPALPISIRVSVKFDLQGIVALLHSLAVKAGGVNPLAIELGVTGQFLDKVLKGKKKPGQTIIKKLGGMVFRPEPIYIIPFIKDEGEEKETLILEWQPKGKATNGRDDKNSK